MFHHFWRGKSSKWWTFTRNMLPESCVEDGDWRPEEILFRWLEHGHRKKNHVPENVTYTSKSSVFTYIQVNLYIWISFLFEFIFVFLHFSMLKTHRFLSPLSLGRQSSDHLQSDFQSLGPNGWDVKHHVPDSEMPCRCGALQGWSRLISLKCPVCRCSEGVDDRNVAARQADQTRNPLAWVLIVTALLEGIGWNWFSNLSIIPLL